MAVTLADELPLLQNPRFVRYTLAKLLHLLGQNALIYGIFIIVVSEQESAVATSAFVLTATVPSILLSLPGGVVADALPRKLTILVTMAIRSIIVWYFIQYDAELVTVVLLTLATWTVYQFFSPAESAALTAVVSPDRIGAANAALNGVSLAAQVLGAGLVAPVALKAIGDDGLFTFVLILYAVAFVLFLSLPRLTPRGVRKRERVGVLRSLPQGWREINGEPTLMRVTMLHAIMDSAVLIVVVAIPAFITDVLRTAPENAVYIFAPAAIGVVAGLLVAPVMLKVVPARAVVTLGFALFAGVVLTLPFIPEVSRELEERTFLPLTEMQDWLNVRPAIAGTALLLPFGGLGLTLVRVASRTAVYQHAAHEVIAQVFATQSAIGSIASLVPTLAAGLLVDLLDVRAVLLLTGSLMAVLAVLAIAGPMGAVRRTSEQLV